MMSLPIGPPPWQPDEHYLSNAPMPPRLLPEPYEPMWKPLPWHIRHPLWASLMFGLGFFGLLWVLSL
jgi:hypothetical protein